MAKKNKIVRVKLIANPGAGNVISAAARLEEVTCHLVEHGMQVDVALAKPKKEAIPIAQKAVKDGYDIIVAMGGDGTIGAVIRGIACSKVKLGIISAGTSNDIAGSLGIPDDLEAAVDLIASGHTRKLDLGKISTKDRKDFYFFSIAAIGLTATIYPPANDFIDGKLSGLKDAVMTLLKYQPKPIINLTLDNESKIEVETMLVTVSNTPMAGIRNLVAPDASTEDGLLDISVYPNFTKAQLLSYFVKTVHGRLAPDGRIQRYRASKIKIKTEPKLDIAAEGIILGKGTCWIEVCPGLLWVIAPEPGEAGVVEKPKTETDQDLPSPVSPTIDKTEAK